MPDGLLADNHNFASLYVSSSAAYAILDDRHHPRPICPELRAIQIQSSYNGSVLNLGRLEAPSLQSLTLDNCFWTSDTTFIRNLATLSISLDSHIRPPLDADPHPLLEILRGNPSLTVLILRRTLTAHAFRLPESTSSPPIVLPSLTQLTVSDDGAHYVHGLLSLLDAPDLTYLHVGIWFDPGTDDNNPTPTSDYAEVCSDLQRNLQGAQWRVSPSGTRKGHSQLRLYLRDNPTRTDENKLLTVYFNSLVEGKTFLEKFIHNPS